MTSAIVVGLARLFAGPGVRWSGCSPELTQRVYFANHTSNLDALILWTSLPKAIREHTRPVAARDYWTVGKLRPYLATKIFDAVLIERKNVTPANNPLTSLLGALDAGSSLIIFPEGGRHDDVEAGPFKSGLYHLARKRPEIELIPVHIDNANRILPKGEILPVPLLSSITFGAPIHLNEGESKNEFLERARASVNALRHE